MKITVLVENTTKNDLKCEHGLSFFIEFENQNYLLDAGTTDIFLENGKAMEVPIYDVSKCILSHGHYDHSGGFETYLVENGEVVVYAMKGADDEYYSGSDGLHYIGIPKKILQDYGERFIFVDKVIKIAEHVYLVPHNTAGLEKIGERAKLYMRKDGEYLPDDFRHEQSLVFQTEKGLIVFNSCSHGGMQNIIREVQEVFPKERIYAFFGGLHMKGKRDGEEICTFTDEELKLLVVFLKEVGLQYLYTGHCTGQVALGKLKIYAGDMIQELFTGRVIRL